MLDLIGTIGSAGKQVIEAGGTASGTTVLNGGIEEVLSGGIEGDLFPFAAGTAIGTIVSSGGEQLVEGRGYGARYHREQRRLRGRLVRRCGERHDDQRRKMEVAGGASISGPITFKNAGGILQLDDSQHFHGLIAGFASPKGVIEEIDLGDITFGKQTKVSFKEDKNHLSGTLTVTNGTQTASLTLLGQYSTGNFNLASDGHGGTMVTDPPLVGSSGHAALFGAQT